MTKTPTTRAARRAVENPPPAGPSITRALSINEPWAWATSAGLKTIENRTWHLPFRGRFAIHASGSLRWLAGQYDDVLDEGLYSIHPQIWNWLDDRSRISAKTPLYQPGAIIGSVELVACLPYDGGRLDDPDELFSLRKYPHAATHPLPSIPHAAWAQGPGVCWVLRDARRYRRPIRCRGKLNLWQLPEVTQRLVAECEGDLLTDPGEPAVDFVEVV